MGASSTDSESAQHLLPIAAWKWLQNSTLKLQDGMLGCYFDPMDPDLFVKRFLGSTIARIAFHLRTKAQLRRKLKL